MSEYILFEGPGPLKASDSMLSMRNQLRQCYVKSKSRLVATVQSKMYIIL